MSWQRFLDKSFLCPIGLCFFFRSSGHKGHIDFKAKIKFNFKWNTQNRKSIHLWKLIESIYLNVTCEYIVHRQDANANVLFCKFSLLNSIEANKRMRIKCDTAWAVGDCVCQQLNTNKVLKTQLKSYLNRLDKTHSNSWTLLKCHKFQISICIFLYVLFTFDNKCNNIFSFTLLKLLEMDIVWHRAKHSNRNTHFPFGWSAVWVASLFIKCFFSNRFFFVSLNWVALKKEYLNHLNSILELRLHCIDCYSSQSHFIISLP